MSSKRLDAVIVNYIGERELSELLFDQPFRESFDRIIVVGNASNDGSVEIVRRAGVDLIQSTANRGFSARANQGLSVSNAEFVAVLHGDARLEQPDSIASLLRRFADPSVALVAPALRHPGGPIQDSAKTAPILATLLLRRRLNERRGARAPDSLGTASSVVGAFVVLRRAQVLEVGGFDERFSPYFADIDLCARLRSRGLRVVLDPSVVVRHRRMEASRQVLAGWGARRWCERAARRYAAHSLIRKVARPVVGDQPRVAALAWGAHSERAKELAQAVNGETRNFGNAGLRGGLSAPVRWGINGVRTAGYLFRKRPRALIVQNPPIFLGLMASVYCNASGARLILDSHPASFGRKNNRWWTLMLPLHRWLARRSAAVLVTERELCEEVESWGGHGLVMHEPPVESAQRAEGGHSVIARRDGRLAVLFVAVFASDEPVEAGVEAACAVPGIDLYVTGELRRAPSDLVERARPEVTFTGFLNGPDYRLALKECDVVMALTTEPTSVMRAAYEGVYAGKPILVSDWPASREMFKFAVHTRNDPAAIAHALSVCAASHAQLREVAQAAKSDQLRRWRCQLARLEQTLPPN